MREALLLVDIQNDFLPGGALEVPHGDEVIAIANRLIPGFAMVVASQDWHPSDHVSFASNQGREVGEVIEIDGLAQILWPDHCVQGTKGAELAPELQLPERVHIIRKGEDRRIDSYSAFFDNGHKRETRLRALLEEKRVKRLYIMGLALDYCVRFSALDSAQLGFETYLIVDGCRAVERKEGDAQMALEEMRQAGVRLLSSLKR